MITDFTKQKRQSSTKMPYSNTPFAKFEQILVTLKLFPQTSAHCTTYPRRQCNTQDIAGTKVTQFWSVMNIIIAQINNNKKTPEFGTKQLSRAFLQLHKSPLEKKNVSVKSSKFYLVVRSHCDPCRFFLFCRLCSSHS